MPKVIVLLFSFIVLIDHNRFRVIWHLFAEWDCCLSALFDGEAILDGINLAIKNRNDSWLLCNRNRVAWGNHYCERLTLRFV